MRTASWTWVSPMPASTTTFSWLRTQVSQPLIALTARPAVLEVSASARILGLEPSTLQSRMNKLGIAGPPAD